MLRIAFCLILSAFAVAGRIPPNEDVVWKDESGRAAPNTGYRNSKNGFGGWLVVTPDADWKQKWETSPETVPHFNTADSVERGKVVTILIFYVNFGLDENKHADVTCDIKSIRPDSSVSIDKQGIQCLEGEPDLTPTYIRLAPAVIKFTAEPSDLAGTWMIRVVLHDNIRHTHLPLKTTFRLQ